MPTVLLVDDSPVVRRVLTLRLEAQGFDVRAESSATGAGEVDLSTLACAVIDIELPDGSGYDLVTGEYKSGTTKDSVVAMRGSVR